jgi:Transglutaminase-like superfamily/Coenzyme PQQ synthesis protein D (PqqD)
MSSSSCVSQSMTVGIHLATSVDGGVLLDVRNDRLLKLNSVATEMLKRLAVGQNDLDIVAEMATEYHVEEGLVKNDLDALRKRIVDLGLSLSIEEIRGEEAPFPSPNLPNFPWYGKPGDAAAGSKTSTWLTLRAFVGLILFDCVLSAFSMNILCRVVKQWPRRKKQIPQQEATLESACLAVERACVWYPKKTLCLQRSAVTACLLRSMGIPAEMVIGTQAMPFRAHAWVEVGGAVINDHKRVKTIYQAITRY